MMSNQIRRSMEVGASRPAALAALIIFFSLILGACIPEGLQLPESPLLRQFERKSGLIAYVGTDFNIYTIDQAGGNMVALTSDARAASSGQTANIYQFPAWSPDGTRLAFVGVRGLGGVFDQVSVFTAAADGTDLIKIDVEPEELPYYLFWSPNSEQVSFLSRSTSGQSGILKLVSADGGEVSVIDAGIPYYWDWSPDGDRMIIHAGGMEGGRLGFLNLRPMVAEEGLSFQPSVFQAPAWSPLGDRVLLAVKEREEGKLILANQRGRQVDTLARFQGSIAFAWSPDGSKVAYIVSDSAFEVGSLGPLTVIDVANPDEPLHEVDVPVIAFFWSPNSERIAYFEPVLAAPPEGSDGPVAPEDQQVLQRVNVLELEEGESHPVIVFLPTQEFVSRLPYFDQYHHSVTIWSPDSKSLVLSGLTTGGDPTIWVLAASGNLTPRFLTEGRLAYWSWK